MNYHEPRGPRDPRPDPQTGEPPLASASVKALGHSVHRSLETHFGEVVNVKGFGAVGNGTANDRLAIQNAFDYAFGPWTAPHGGATDAGSALYTNRAVYFPPGHYLVRSLIESRAITGAGAGAVNPNGGNYVRLTVDTTGLADLDIVNVAGIAGLTGSTSINHSWFIDVVDPTHIDLYYSTFAGTWTPGTGTITTPCLRLRMVQGAHIYGAGRFVSRLESGSANAAVIATSAMAYSKIENMAFHAYDNGIAFQLDRSGRDTTNTTVNTQSNTFQNCQFGGIGGHTPAYGLKIGFGQSMGSENLILNCYISDFSIAGVFFGNFNACDNTLIGGNIAGCGKGIYVESGSCNTIHGVSLQNNTLADIHINNGASDSYSIVGCRSESKNFLLIGASQPFNISGCNQRNDNSGFFVSGAGYVTINSCNSQNGYIEGTNGRYSVINSFFERADYLTAGPATNFASLHVVPMPVTVQTGATYSLQSYDVGTKVQFNRATAQTVTVLNNVDTTLRTVKGSKIEVQQIGAGQVTFIGSSGAVQIRSANGLKLRTQWSCATLTCDGDNIWTLSGDTAV